MLLCIFIEATLPYLQAVSEHGDVLPPGDSLNGSVSIPLANGFPYGTIRSFQIYVSAHIRVSRLSSKDGTNTPLVLLVNGLELSNTTVIIIFLDIHTWPMIVSPPTKVYKIYCYNEL